MKRETDSGLVVSTQFLRDWRTNPPQRLSRKYLAVCVLLAAVYFAGGKLGLMLAFFHPSATPVWPPTGIALAALLLLGYRVWPAIFVGAFFVNFTTAGTLATSFGIAIGNTAEALVGAYLVNRFAGGLRAFDRPETILRFAALAGLLSTAVSATVGVTTLSLGGFADWANFGSIWLTWWLGDAVGAVSFAPALVHLWIARPLPRWDLHRILEAIALGGGLFLAGWVAFGPLTSVDSPIKFISIPFLIWAAFRFSKLEAALAVVLLSGVGVWSLPYSSDFFGLTSLPQQSLLVLQGFIGIMGVMTMTVAAVVAEQKRMEEALRTDRDELQEQVATDVLELAVASEQVRQSEAMLKRAQQIARIGSFQWDAVANRVTWSDEMYRIYGLVPAEFPGTLDAFLSRVHPDDRTDVRAAVERAVRERQPFRLRERIVRTGGEIRVLDSWGEVVLDSAGEVLALQGVCRDITEDVAAERTLQDLAGKLIHAQEEERSRIGRELHDHVSQRAGLLSIKLDEIRADSIGDPALSERLSELSERVNDLAKDIHVLSYRLHSSTLEYLGLVPALQHLVADFSTQKHLRIEFSADSAPSQIPSDIALCLYRVTEESLNNSAKHSGAQSARVVLAATEQGIRLLIEDQGTGFDPAALNGKAGLGLVSMRERLRLVQGILRIHSAPSQGTRIEAWIPSMSLLLVEDNPGDATLIRRMIAEMAEHFRVTHVTCLAQGLDRLRQGAIDVILLDLGLPDSVGLDTLSRIRAQAPNVPIIVISGQSDRKTARLALDQGAQGFVAKEEIDAQLLERLSRTVLSEPRGGAAGDKTTISARVGAV